MRFQLAICLFFLRGSFIELFPRESLYASGFDFDESVERYSGNAIRLIPPTTPTPPILLFAVDY
jgi:hypothetical protein